MSYLIAESGSTKTDWCLLKKGKKPVYFKTSGINPYLQKEEDILKLLQTELPWDSSVHKAEAISYYGAGAASKEKQAMLKKVLKKFFGTADTEVNSDMLAAARGICGEKKGIVCILGTGSASCYYDGKAIKETKASLGYVAGDEGSGNHMGKRVLQYYAYKTFDETLKATFEKLYGNDLGAILDHIYREPFPNRYLAGMTQLLKEHRGHFMVENIIEDCFNDFFHHNVLKYRQSWKYPLYFTGSVAYEFQDVLAGICHQYELDLSTVERSPMEGLLKYHKALM
jgi:N-acetylglucosamine kinase-like BadF-type ATPase